MLFANKQKRVESQLAEYREQVALCLETMYRSFKEYCASGDRVRLSENLATISGVESRADDIRREIEVMMYSKALFPESRGDILGLLETMDRVPNQAEAVVRMLRTHHIMIPQDYCGGIMELARLCQRCVGALLDASAKLFEDFTNATVAIGRIDELESEADKVEESLTERIFASDLEGSQKLILADLIKRIASVSDRAENAGDRIRIVVAKRRT